jgi:hypothetical protein
MKGRTLRVQTYGIDQWVGRFSPDVYLQTINARKYRLSSREQR